MAMLLDKLAGRPFRSELALLQPRAVAPAPALGDTTASRLALITSGRLVPRGNPDRMPHRHSRHRFEYELPTAGLMPGEWESIHAGYHVAAVNADPNVVLPLDAVRRLLDEGRIGSLPPGFNRSPVSARRTRPLARSPRSWPIPSGERALTAPAWWRPEGRVIVAAQRSPWSWNGAGSRSR